MVTEPRRRVRAMSRWGYYLPILSYYRIGPLRSDRAPTVSAQTFERHLQWLTAWRVRVLSLGAVVRLVERRWPLPRRSVVLTIDDGYAETHEIAWPLLKRYGFSAAVFVIPSRIGQPGFTTWEQVADMAREGVLIGSHTMHHAYLPLVSAERLVEEIVEAKRMIEASIGRPVHYLSYPLGGFGATIQAAARQAGFRGACTTNRAWFRRGMDLFALRRIKMTERDAHLLRFRAKVSGYYDMFRHPDQPA